MRHRSIPCPLCGSPVLRTHLTSLGLCIECKEARETSQEAAQEAAEARENSAAALAHSLYQRAQEGRLAREKAAAEAARQKELAAKKKEVTAAQRELASRELARRSILHFTERRLPGYKTAFVHELICQQLEQFVQDVADKKSPRLILSVCSRAGKALAHDTPVLTYNRGWTTHGDLVVGDQVFGLDGRPTEVVATSEEFDCDVELEFSTGETITCSAEHEWKVRRLAHRNRRSTAAWETVEAKELLSTRLCYKDHTYLVDVPKTPRLCYAYKRLHIDPYVLGVWLGDGDTIRGKITHHTGDIEHIAEMEKRGYSVSSRYIRPNRLTVGQVYFRGKEDTPFGHALDKFGLRAGKFIPDIYERSSVKQRLDLVAGLVDTDGMVSSSGRVGFYNTNHKIISSFVRILRSLGEDPGIKYQPARSYVMHDKVNNNTYAGEARECWLVRFTPKTRGFWSALKRKNARLYSNSPTSSRDYYSIIRAERATTSKKGKCIQVAASDGMYLAGETLIPTHNSELASKSLPMWVLGKHPNWTIMNVSYSDELPIEFSRDVREMLQSADYAELFPHGARLDPTDQSVKSWGTIQGGGFKATGIGGAALGFGCDILVLDDVVKNAEIASNREALEKQYQWFSSVAYSRLMPGGGVLLIGQRMSTHDLIGRVLKNQREEEKRLAEMRAEVAAMMLNPDKTDEDIREIAMLTAEADELDESIDRWKLVEYRALATEDEYYDYKEAQIVKVPAGAEPDPAWKPLRKKGEALHSARYTRSYWLKLKRANPVMFASMMMLQPIDEEGSYFAATDFNRYQRGHHPKLDQMHIFAAWDLAISAKQSGDYTVGVIGGIDHTGSLWILDMIRGRFPDVRITSDLIIDLHKKYHASLTGIEQSHISQAIGPILRSRMAERNEFIALAEGKERLLPTTDKFVRARQLQGLAKAGKVYIPEGEDFDVMISELAGFSPTAEHDDIVDALAWLAILALRQAPPPDPARAHQNPVQRFVSWLDELYDEYSSQGSKSFMES